MTGGRETEGICPIFLLPGLIEILLTGCIVLPPGHMALSLANGCRMWYTIRAGLLAGVGAFPGCFGWAAGRALVLYGSIVMPVRVFVNSYGKHSAIKI